MYKKGDHVHVSFDAVVVEGDEASNYVVVEAGSHFGLAAGVKVSVHFERMKLSERPK